MTHPSAARLPDPSVTIIIVGARCWRRARNRGAPIQPALFVALDRYRCGVLVPAVDSLMTLYEACTGRLFRTGGNGTRWLSHDESQLLGLLAADGDGSRLDTIARPGLVAALRISLQSTRILIARALPAPEARAAA